MNTKAGIREIVMVAAVLLVGGIMIFLYSVTFAGGIIKWADEQDIQNMTPPDVVKNDLMAQQHKLRTALGDYRLNLNAQGELDVSGSDDRRYQVISTSYSENNPILGDVMLKVPKKIELGEEEIDVDSLTLTLYMTSNAGNHQVQLTLEDLDEQSEVKNIEVPIEGKQEAIVGLQYIKKEQTEQGFTITARIIPYFN
jgi:hypothetical protein